LDADTFTCPRCFHTGPLTDDLRFCPRCGLTDVRNAARDTAPLTIPLPGGRTLRVLDRLAIGSVCTLYRCRIPRGKRETQGLFKIAREPTSNHRVLNEAQTLRRLHSLDPTANYTPFLPALEESLAVGDPSTATPRQANILRLHDDIASPDELYTLVDVRHHYPRGVDPKDVAWIWRRLLAVLGFAHDAGVVHAAVLPMHVLIEPREHKLVLVDWCWAAVPSDPTKPIDLLPGGYAPWYKRHAAATRPPVPALDLALAARCMIELLGGDPLRAHFPPALDPALQRYFQRCLAPGVPGAWQLLNDFDRLIELLWGPRTFRAFHLPPKTRPQTKGA
jgi:hypothetical protein